MIRSYHRAFTMETKIYTVGDKQLWKPIPVAGVAWFVGFLALMFLAAHFVLTAWAVRMLPWWVTYVGLPLGLSYLAGTAKIQGRRLHVTLRAIALALLAGKRVNGAGRRLHKPGEQWRPHATVRITKWS